jgi:2-hydroxycyclohexanecarboxyl-CoA dehydrogenase
MDLQLSGKVAIVTGAGRHIGRQIALTLAQEGTKVAINDYFEDRANSVANEITSAGGEAIGIRADVGNVKDVEAMTKKVLTEFGKVDILVNNAGGIRTEPTAGRVVTYFPESDKTDWHVPLDVYFYGVINCTKAVIGNMVNQRSGKIVCITGDSAKVGEAGRVPMSAARAGVAGFAKALAREVGRYCINVNCVSPGATPDITTQDWQAREKSGEFEKLFKSYPMANGLRRMAMPSDIANMVVFLCSDASIFITGQHISASGGYTMIG